MPFTPNPFLAPHILHNTRAVSADEEKDEKDDPEEGWSYKYPGVRKKAERRELKKAAELLTKYRTVRGIKEPTPAEKLAASYKRGTKRVPKTGIARLHKGEAVLSKREAKKYRARGVKGSARILGAGKHKRPAKKGAITPATQAILRTGTSGQGSLKQDAEELDRQLYEKRELRKTIPLLKAYRDKHGIGKPTPAEDRLPELVKKQTVRFS